MNVVSIDVESNGLWGAAIAIATIVYDRQGKEIVRFIGRLPDTEVTDDWVQENVLPKMTNIPVTHDDYELLLVDFAAFYMANKDGADIITHVGFPVETKLFFDMHRLGYIDDWDAPYPLIDVSSLLKLVGANPVSVDRFAADHGIEVAVSGGTHNPIYDAALTAAVYQYLMDGRKN